jgi:hypothetical protein
MSKNIIEEMKDYFTNRLFFFDGSIEFPPEGGVLITPSKDPSAGKCCPYCGMPHTVIIPAAGIGGIIKGGGNTWAIHDCKCFSCQGFYMMLINEISERIIICDKLHPKSAGKD